VWYVGSLSLSIAAGLTILGLTTYTIAWFKMAIVHRPISPAAALFIDNPLRRMMQPPGKVVNWINIQDGMKVLEIGPGPGTFTTEAARRVGTRGQLFAVDIQQAIISRLNKRLTRKGMGNVTTQMVDAAELPYPNNMFDRIFMIAVVGEIAKKDKTFAQISRVLKGDGLLAVGEFLQDPDYTRRKTMLRLAGSAGFDLVSSYQGTFHYLLTFRKNGKGHISNIESG
jgi:ubiquinone/menaquinone biosynthesis C-methylase UbiE